MVINNFNSFIEIRTWLGTYLAYSKSPVITSPKYNNLFCQTSKNVGSYMQVYIFGYCPGNCRSKMLWNKIKLPTCYSIFSMSHKISGSIKLLKCLCFPCCRSWGQSRWVNGTHERGGRLETKEKNSRGRERHGYYFVSF